MNQDKLKFSKTKRLLISMFIIFNAVGIVNSSSKSKSERSLVEDFFSPYLNWTRLNQRWLLFTPEPRRMAMKYHVNVYLKNGETQIWRRPYPPNWDFFARHLSYQYQKWDLASEFLDDNRFVQKDLVHFLRYFVFNDESNPPIRMTLVKETADWPAPNQEGYVRSDEARLNWKERVIFNYDVQTDQVM